MNDAFRSAIADRYILDEELGRGGMAVVYAARDQRHSRRVAMKVLSAEESGSRNADRFQHEIRIAAALAHPHILPVFDSGAAAGQLFYTMPLVDGESLRSRIQREGRIPTEDAVKLAREVADALDCAHRAGVIHRDVKPENILLAHGHAVLADFGIARDPTRDLGGTLTMVGTFVGTPNYMSPDLLLGESPPGPWSDLYALGCVLFEMLTGAPPHVGATSQATLANRVAKGPPRLRDQRPELSQSLEVAIGRVLATTANERYATAAHFADALLTTTVAASRDAEVSLVLRPFDAVGGDDTLDEFADGLTEEAIHDLSKVRALRVISRTSAMRLKRTHKDVRTIGREYGVRYVVTGSVRKSGQRVRVTSELVDAVLDASVWSGRVDGSLDDPFAIQEQVATRIVDALHLKLSEDERSAIAAQEFSDPRAQDCYRSAMNDILGFSAEGLARAKTRIDAGLELVGEHPLMLVALGAWHWQGFNAGLDVNEARLDDAQRYFDRALAIDPELPQAHVLVGWIHLSRGRVVEGIRSLYRALRKDPHHTHALALLAVAFWVTGRQTEMREFVSRLRAVDPFDFYGLLIEGFVEAVSDNREQRDACMRQAFAISSAPAALFFHALVYAQDAEPEPARTLFSRPELQAQDDFFKWLSHAAVAAMDGNTQPAIELSKDANMSALVALDPQWGWHLSEVLAMAGLVEQSLDVLSQAVNNGLSNVLMIESRDATLAPIRGHVRFPAILANAKRLDASLEESLRKIKAAAPER